MNQAAGRGDHGTCCIGDCVMGRAIMAISGSAVALLPRPFAGLGHAAAAFWRDLTRHMFNDYRPELHYMRGPGPAWRAKQSQRPAG